MNTKPNITTRFFRDEFDFWRIRSLIQDTFSITPLDFNWEVRRWDGQLFHNENIAPNPDWTWQIKLWETGDGRLVGAVVNEDIGYPFLQIHPDYRYWIEGEMLDFIEATYGEPVPATGKKAIHIIAHEYDAARIDLLQKRGYTRTDDYEIIRRLRFGTMPLPEVNIAQGYTLRTTPRGDWDDCQRIADLLNAAFRRTRHTAKEYYPFMMHSPSWFEALNLVAVAPDGSFAAHVGVNYDPANRLGIFEPVCTHPDHRQKGLAQNLMFEGLHRLKSLGAIQAIVGTGDMAPANALYNSIGFSEVYKGYEWMQEIG